ncbi:MAG: virulence RhuM family protein [Paludibacteraceae bacterium]|nr:virulence RhuM family protein [Paludibacteraceae bacterium]
MKTLDLTKDTKGEIVIYQSEEGRVSVDVLFQDETVWLPIEQMSILFGKSRSTINEHILNIYKEGELSEADTVRKIGISDFSTKPTNFYNLDVVISVGYRVHSMQGTRFRQWATQRIHEYIIKGYTLDDERLKGNGGRYFRELLQRIRDIRSSERNLYQQVTDIYATAVDYDPKAEITRQFFATVQNKMHYAAHQHTAAEVVYDRVDNEKPMLGMTNFKGNYITKDDVTIAKNYLTEIELQRLNLLVSQFFDYAELQAMEQHPMTMQEWIDELDRVLSNNRRPLLEGSGSICHQQAQEKAVHEYTIYRQREMNQLESDYDRAIRQLSLFSGSTEQLSGETSIDEE